MSQNYFSYLIFSFLFFSLSQAAGAQVKTHNLSFETADGIYGHIVVKSKPVEMGGSYVVLDAKSLVVEGMRGHSRIYSYSFPLQVQKFTVNLSGSGCIYLNSSQPHCGNFNVNYLSSATSDYTSVGFSQASKDKYKELRENDKSLSWENDGYVDRLQVDDVSADIFRKIKAAANKPAATGSNDNSGSTQSSYSGSNTNSSSYSNSSTTSNSSSNSERNSGENNSTSDEAAARERRQIEQIQEQTRINNGKNEAYAEAASVAAQGLAQGLSEGLITGMTLSYNTRYEESDSPGAILTVLDVPTYELGIQMGEKANSGFSIGYGPGDEGVIYDSGSSYVYVTGLDIGILNLGKDVGALTNCYAFQLSLGGEFGLGSGEFKDGGYYGDEVVDVTEDLTFYGGHLNAKFMKYFFAGYGYGFANGSVTEDGETTEYDVLYSKITMGLRIPF